MAYTIDRRPGTAYRELEYQVASTGPGSVVSGQGGIRYNGAAFQMLDAVGQYDPRTAAILAHATTFDMPHIIAGTGPMLQGAYKTQTFVLGAFLDTETWWASRDQVVKLSTHRFLYSTGNFTNPISEIWTLFSGDASNIPIRTVTDSMVYSGISEVSRTRSYS